MEPSLPSLEYSSLLLALTTLAPAKVGAFVPVKPVLASSLMTTPVRLSRPLLVEVTSKVIDWPTLS